MTGRSSETSAAKVSAVMSLCLAAGHVARCSDEGIVALAKSSGLSVEGVRFAFERSLEHRATDGEIRALVERANGCVGSAVEPPKRVTLLLSANVFTAPLRAIALARARAARVVVKPSRRDPVFARLLVEASNDPGITIEEVDLDAVHDGEIHAYGRAETLAAIARRARVSVWEHGPGFGVALVDGDDVNEAAVALADDIALFDQRGCMSPRAIWVTGGDARARRLAERLHEALEASRVPRGELQPGEAAVAERWALTQAMTGDVFRGRTHGVALALEALPFVLPPDGRHVVVRAANSLRAVEAALAPFASDITNIGLSARLDAPNVRLTLPPCARRSAIGAMQTIPFDGPVDGRASRFGVPSRR